MWLSLIGVIFINVILSGDNAVVIALACRKLPESQRKLAVFWGSTAAIVLRVGLTFVAVALLKLPLVQACGGLLLIWIAIQLMRDDHDTETVRSGGSIVDAIRTVLVADLIMSLDNVVAVAGAAGGNLVVIVIGLAVSIPLIIWGSQLLMKLMNRFPIIVMIGAALLGYTAGEMIRKDRLLDQWLEFGGGAGEYVLPVMMAAAVVLVGRRMQTRH